MDKKNETRISLSSSVTSVISKCWNAEQCKAGLSGVEFFHDCILEEL